MHVDLSLIPDGWFLQRMTHVHSRIIFAGEKHVPVGWLCELQHVSGGRLKIGKGDTPLEALADAISQIQGGVL